MASPLHACCLMCAVLVMAGCGADVGSAAPAPAMDAAAGARATAAARSVAGTWTGTARPAPVVNAGLAPHGPQVALVLPLAALFAEADGAPPSLPPFIWTITVQTDGAGGVTGSYADDAGRRGALSGTTDPGTGVVEFSVGGTAPGGSFVLRCGGVIVPGQQTGDAAEFDISQMSIAHDGGAALALISTARWVAVIPRDAVLIEEDILDP